MFPFTRISRKRWLSKRSGKSHGRQGLPSSDWNGGPVPHLEKLRAEYGQKVQNLVLRLRVAEGQSLTASELDIADKKSLQYEADQLEKERSVYESDLQRMLGEKLGEPADSPSSKVSRFRHISSWIYIAALISLATGEFFVTLPAVRVILNDSVWWQVYVITGSFSALSIIAAHLIGITFKIDIDRDKPQPGYHKWVAFIIFIILFFAVLFLSSLRSQGVSGVPVKFGLSDEVFGTVLFTIVQIAFILCAVALSYYYHSDLESEIKACKRKIKKLTSKIRKTTKALHNPNDGKLSQEKQVVQNKAILDDIEQLEAEYREMCAIYRGANLLAQKVSFNNPGPGLTENPLPVPKI